MMTKDFKDLLRAFNANAVKYLIIGAHAFGVHAEPRITKDLDLRIVEVPSRFLVIKIDLLPRRSGLILLSKISG